MAGQMTQKTWWQLVHLVIEPKVQTMNGEREPSYLMDSVERLRLIEIIASMKSNNGNVKQWAKELENAIGIEEIVITNGVIVSKLELC
jgi:hypothetical protein